MLRGRVLKWMLVPSLLLSITLLGCGGGSSSQPTPPSPAIQVLPAAYDFGPVTPFTPVGSPAPLKVEIKNTGTASLNVSNISLVDTINFSLNLNGGASPCSSASPTLAAGDRCTLEVEFQPQSDASFSTNLTINSNDPTTSAFNLALSGSKNGVTALTVRINQVEIACPAGVVTAYVSVTDQGGYPVTSLTKDDFLVTEFGGFSGAPASSPFVGNNATISAALVMDYSTSVTSVPDKVSDMEEGAVSFVNQLKAGDEAEIVKFGPIVEVVQDYTSDNTLLISAINAPWDEGVGTALYDACKVAVDNTALRSKDRKAVVVITDGFDFDSTITVNDLINMALSNNVPLFPVGVGDTVDNVVLNQMADQTGGQYYAASTSDNLQTVYQQLADVLFSFQYILTYNSGLADGTTANLTVGATLPSTTITESNTRSITKCP